MGMSKFVAATAVLRNTNKVLYCIITLKLMFELCVMGYSVQIVHYLLLEYLNHTYYWSVYPRLP